MGLKHTKTNAATKLPYGSRYFYMGLKLFALSKNLLTAYGSRYFYMGLKPQILNASGLQKAEPVCIFNK